MSKELKPQFLDCPELNIDSDKLKPGKYALLTVKPEDIPEWVQNERARDQGIQADLENEVENTEQKNEPQNQLSFKDCKFW